MNAFKLAALAAALSFGAGAQAATLNTVATGHLNAGQQLTIQFSIDNFIAGNATISAKVKSDLDGKFKAPVSFAIYNDSNVLISTSDATPGNLAGTSYTFSNLATGTYTAKLTEGAFGGVYTIASKYQTTFISASAVPEPESVALAFAGLGVAGLLLKRRSAAV